MLKAAQAYFQTQVTTTSQGHLLLLLYDGAIKFLKQAKEKIQEKNYAEKGMLISKAMDVINELDSSLNSHKGGEIAANLHNLYFFCNTRLLKANLNMDCVLIDEVIKILAGLRDAFAQIMKPGAADAPQPLAAKPAAAQPAYPAPPQRPAAAPPAQSEALPAAQPANAQETILIPSPPLRPPIVPGQAPAPRPTVRPVTPLQAAAGAAPTYVAAPSAAPGAAPVATPPPKGHETVPLKPAAGRLLAGANFYKKMATQT